MDSSSECFSRTRGDEEEASKHDPNTKPKLGWGQDGVGNRRASMLEKNARHAVCTNPVCVRVCVVVAV